MKRGKNRPKAPEGRSLQVFPQYREDQYSELLRVSDDPNSLPANWDEYQRVLEQAVRDGEIANVDVYLVDVNLYDLIAYCAELGNGINAASRAGYAFLRAAKEDRGVRRVFCGLLMQRHPKEFEAVIEDIIRESLEKRKEAGDRWNSPLPRGSIRARDLISA